MWEDFDRDDTWVIYRRSDLTVGADGRLMLLDEPVTNPGTVLGQFDENSFVFRVPYAIPPAQTSYTPTQTSYTPTQTSYGPAQTSYTPTETSYGGGGGGGGPGEPSYDNDDEQEQPPKHCFDGTVLPPNGKCSKCPTGYTETMSSSGYQTCIAPQPPKFVGFRAADGIQATGHLEVRPSLGRSGYVARVYWNVTNVRDCTVRGSNGDGASGSRTGPWNTSASGSSGKATSPITRREVT
jgi:hypothetical protein